MRKRKKLDLLAVPEDALEEASETTPLASSRWSGEEGERLPHQLAMF
jgi:hypothetical protein